MCTCIYVCVHLCMYMYLCVHVHILMCVHSYSSMHQLYMHMYICAHVYTYTHVYICTHIYIHTYNCMLIYSCISIYTYIYDRVLWLVCILILWLETNTDYHLLLILLNCTYFAWEPIPKDFLALSVTYSLPFNFSHLRKKEKIVFTLVRRKNCQIYFRHLFWLTLLYLCPQFLGDFLPAILFFLLWNKVLLGKKNQPNI